MVTDTTSDFLTRIRNASLIKSQRVIVPKTNGNVALTKFLNKKDTFQDLKWKEIT